MRLNLKIEDLPMATSWELYQLSWIIEKLLADPRRIVQARSQMHLGQQVQFFNWPDGKLRAGQVVSMKDSRVAEVKTLREQASSVNVQLAAAIEREGAHKVRIAELSAQVELLTPKEKADAVAGNTSGAGKKA